MKYGRTILLSVVACLIAAPPLEAQRPLSRSPADWDTRAGLRTESIEISTKFGFPASLFVSRPVKQGRLPAVVFIPWLSCDPVEVPKATDDGYIRLVRDIAVRSRWVVIRAEKPGVAGSEGPACEHSTLTDDLGAFHAALEATFRRADVDTSRVFLVGGSIGGALAVLLASTTPHRLAGLVSVNSFGLSWYEHMIDLERRRLQLNGSPIHKIAESMREFEGFYDEFLNEQRIPGDIIASRPAMKSLWYDEARGQYGRTAAYFHQVQRINLDSALASLRTRSLFISAEYDWIMGQEAEQAARTVNRALPASASARVYSRLGHGLERFGSLQAAFAGRGGVYEERVAADIVSWMQGASTAPVRTRQR